MSIDLLMLKIKNLNYEREGFQLKALSLEIPFSNCISLMGPSGSGKTTLLNILIGIEKANPEFSWFLGSECLSEKSIEDKKIGVVFQGDSLFSNLTALENIDFAIEARKLKPKETIKDELIEHLELQKCLKTKAHFLSGGEKQRVALARALVAKPKMLILDEPFSSLDEKLKDSSRLMVKNIQKKYKIPTLLVTHDEKDSLYLAQETCIIREGEILYNK